MLSKMLSDKMIARGFVTSQIIVPKQNLKDGVLKFKVVPGYIEDIRFEPQSTFPDSTGDVLNNTDLIILPPYVIVRYRVQLHKGVINMLAANFSTVRKNFKGYCDTANNDLETVIITRKEGGNAVLMSEAEYNNIMENLFVRSNKETYSRLKESINQLEQG